MKKAIGPFHEENNQVTFGSRMEKLRAYSNFNCINSSFRSFSFHSKSHHSLIRCELPFLCNTLDKREKERHTERETNRETERQRGRQRDRDRQEGRQRDRQRDRQTDRETQRDTERDRQRGRQRDRQRGRQRDRETDREAGRLTNREGGRQAGRQAGRLTNRLTDTETHRDREKETNINKRPQRKKGKSHLGWSRSLLDVLQQVIEGTRDGRGSAAQVLQKVVLIAGGLRCRDDALHRLGHQLGCFYQLLLARWLTNGRCHNLHRHQATL